MAPLLELVRPDEKFAQSYEDFISEMRNLGEKIWDSHIPRESETMAGFISRLLAAEASPGPVAATSYWAVQGREVVGRIALRHALDKDLEEFGGHIGYEVRPSARKRGVATEMLRQLLQTSKAREIGRLLLTCAPDNTASNKTIQKNGGLLAGTKFVERVQRQTNYYWIAIP